VRARPVFAPQIGVCDQPASHLTPVVSFGTSASFDRLKSAMS